MGGREGKGKVKGRGGRKGKREGREGERPPTAFWTNRTLRISQLSAKQ